MNTCKNGLKSYLKWCKYGAKSKQNERILKMSSIIRFSKKTSPSTFNLGALFGAFGAARVDFRCFLVAPAPHRKIMFFSTSPKIHKIDDEIEPVQMTRWFVLKIGIFKRRSHRKCEIFSAPSDFDGSEMDVEFPPFSLKRWPGAPSILRVTHLFADPAFP